MNIKWNECTWYSKLAAIIFFIGIFPVWTFYLGMKYEEIFLFGKTSEVSLPNIVTSSRKIYTVTDLQNNGYGFQLTVPSDFTIDKVSPNLVNFRSPSMVAKEKEIEKRCRDSGHPGVCAESFYPDFDVEFNQMSIGSDLHNFLTHLKTLSFNSISWDEYQLSGDFFVKNNGPLYLFHTKKGSFDFVLMGPNESTIKNIVNTFTFIK
jgi:hypothetical protein